MLSRTASWRLCDVARSARDTTGKHHRVERICKGKKKCPFRFLGTEKKARKSQRNRCREAPSRAVMCRFSQRRGQLR